MNTNGRKLLCTSPSVSAEEKHRPAHLAATRLVVMAAFKAEFGHAISDGMCDVTHAVTEAMDVLE